MDLAPIRILRNRRGRLTLVCTDVDGSEIVATGSVTAAVVDSAGTALAGSPYTASLRSGTTGTYDITIPAASLGTLDLLDVTWTFRPSGATSDETQRQQARVVGSYLFTIPEMRSFDAVLTEANQSDAKVWGIRDIVEEAFEKACRVAFTPQGYRATLDGNGKVSILVPHTETRVLVSGSIDGIAMAAADITDVAVYAWGVFQRKERGSWTAGERNVVLLYEHGYVTPPPEVSRAGMQLARHLLRSGPLENERATAVFTDVGGMRLSLAGRDGPTGLPEVDAVLARWSRAQAGAFA
ncbi:MAG: hypothetical protein ACRDHM_07445 [Actinomycetota bacterium]